MTPSRRSFLSGLLALPVAQRFSRPAKLSPDMFLGIRRTFYVGGAGSFSPNYATLREALDAANRAGGGIVYLLPGTHEV